MNKPSVFIIGAQKAGTTALCDLLDQHDDIFMCDPKEPMFFSQGELRNHPNMYLFGRKEWYDVWVDQNENFPKEPLKQYLSHFEDAQHNQLCAEGSTSYLTSPSAAKRTKAFNPEAKIIVMLRDPVARAYSAYWHHVANAGIAYTFSKMLAWGGHNIFEGGLYHQHLAHWYDAFPKEQIYVCLFETFKRDPIASTNDICKFLNISNLPSTTKINKQNEARTPILYQPHLFLNYIGSTLRTHPDTSAPIRNWLVSAIYKLKQQNLRNWPYPPMDIEMETFLTQSYRPHSEELAELTGLDLKSQWKSMKD